MEDLERVILDFTPMRAFAKDPFLFANGEGIRITDVNGKHYLVGLSGVFVNSLGYRNQAIVEAVTAQLQRLHFAPPLHGTSPVAVELVGKERGLPLRSAADFVAFAPPLIVTRADLDAMCDILEDSLVAVEEELLVPSANRYSREIHP